MFRLLNDPIQRALASADVPARLCQVTTVNDQTVSAWSGTSLALSHLDRAVTGPGAVATEAAETRKHTKYSSLAATYYFVPVAVETLGALGAEAAAFFSISADGLQPRPSSEFIGFPLSAPHRSKTGRIFLFVNCFFVFFCVIFCHWFYFVTV